MAFSLFTKAKSARGPKNGRELTLVVDIESGVVRGSLALFSYSEGDNPPAPPHILHSVSAEITPRENGTGNKSGIKLLSAMLGAVSGVAENMSIEGLKIAAENSVQIPISKINVVLSSPWIISKTKTVKISYGKETEITRAAVNAILDGERRDLEQKFLAEHDSSLEFDLAFIEQKLFEVKLNGYPTVHFEGKKTRELEVSFATSVSSKNIVGRIEQILEKSIRTAAHAVEYHSSLLLQYSALRAIVPGFGDYVVIHVHKEITDIIVVKNGTCSAMASFPSGTALFSDSKDVTSSSLNLQSQGVLHVAEDGRIMELADSILETWTRQFKETLASIGQTGTVPRRVYLLADEHYPHFERAIVSAGASSGASQPFAVAPIEKNILDAHISHEKKENEDQLMNLYVFALR